MKDGEIVTVSLRSLSYQQQEGLACVRCRAVFDSQSPRKAVARTGAPLHDIYACLGCVRLIRVLTWPDFGSV